MSIKLDFREHGLSEELKKLGVEFSVENLALGDIIIGDRVVIERKSVDDLWHSICDGRYREQTNRLRECNGDIVAFLIEGVIKKPSIWGCMASWTLRDGFHVWRTKNIKESAKWIQTLSRKFDSCGSGSSNTSGDIKMIRKKIMDTPGDVFLHQLTVINGVSISKAKAIIEQFPTIRELLNKGTIESISSIMCGKRKIGKVLAKRIYSVMIEDINKSDEMEEHIES